MRNITSHVGELKIINRMESSYYGNPRFLISIDGIKCVTGVDSMFGYSVQNYDGKMVNARIGIHYNRATLYEVEAVK